MDTRGAISLELQTGIFYQKEACTLPTKFMKEDLMLSQIYMMRFLKGELKY